MKNNKLYESMEYLGYVFDPLIVYECSYFLHAGDFSKIFNYDFNKDILYLNSNKINGKNAYASFLNKNFYNLISKDIDIVNKCLVPLLISELSEDGKKRFVRFDYTISLLNILKIITKGNMQNDLSEDLNDIASYVYNFVKSKRNRILNVIRLGKHSVHYNEILEYFNNNMPNNNILQNEADLLTSLIFVIKNIINLIDNNTFDLDGFKNCFDKDKLYLTLAKIIVDDTLYVEKIDNKINNALIEVIQYINLVDEIGLKDYNPSILYYDEKLNKTRKYTFQELRKEITSILARHPEFKFIQITNEEAKKQNVIKDLEGAKKFAERVSTRETLLANWEFVRRGSIDKEKENTKLFENIKNVKDKKNNKKNNRDYYKELLEKRELFESTSYVYRIVGIDKFEGYIGFIYSNGIVAFEKMYEDKEQTIPAKGSNAIYIMTIENFVEFSKKSKIEIIEYIKNTNNPNIWRLYHNDTVKSRLMRFINGVYYSKEVEEAIDKMLEEQVIAKKLQNKKD